MIDTTNFLRETSFRGSSANLHLVERLTRVDANTLLYEFTVDDPKTWTTAVDRGRADEQGRLAHLRVRLPRR